MPLSLATRPRWQKTRPLITRMRRCTLINIPNYANALVTTDEIVASILLSKLSRQFYILKG
jgi:hypothetical protein